MSADPERFAARLIRLREDLLSFDEGDRDRARPVELDQTAVGRLSRMDALQGQAMSAAVRRRRETTLRRIAAALERLEEGEFGYCLKCGEAIAVARLEIDPVATLCTACAEGEHGRRRP